MDQNSTTLKCPSPRIKANTDTDLKIAEWLNISPIWSQGWRKITPHITQTQPNMEPTFFCNVLGEHSKHSFMMPLFRQVAQCVPKRLQLNVGLRDRCLLDFGLSGASWLKYHRPPLLRCSLPFQSWSATENITLRLLCAFRQFGLRRMAMKSQTSQKMQPSALLCIVIVFW